jgi:hypothetical protein
MRVPQIESLPPRLGELVARAVGEWYLRFAGESHTFVWLTLTVGTVLLALAGAFFVDSLGSAADEVVYATLAALVVLVLMCATSLPLFDRTILQLVWRQVSPPRWHSKLLISANATRRRRAARVRFARLDVYSTLYTIVQFDTIYLTGHLAIYLLMTLMGNLGHERSLDWVGQAGAGIGADQ